MYQVFQRTGSRPAVANNVCYAHTLRATQAMNHTGRGYTIHKREMDRHAVGTVRNRDWLKDVLAKF